MPEIARFYGIVIKMFFDDYSPPQIHAAYGDYVGFIDIKKCKMINGDLSPLAKKMVEKWTKQHKDALLKMWETQKIKKLSPLA
jgi:hypothetical protein